MAAIVAAGPCAAGEPAAVYTYRIEHPRYGDIGTYTNVVKQAGDASEVDTVLHIAVRILGIVMYREDAQRTERWQGDRLTAFNGVTDTNGKKIAIHGKAKGNDFQLTTPRGTVMVPGRVHPSNPWGPEVLHTDLMMSTKSGHVDHVHVSGGDLVAVKFDGRNYRLRRYEVDGEKRQFVWVDDRDVAVAFRTVEDGTPVDFVLADLPQEVAQAQQRADRN
ncbi:MAG TPA: DUF6134 family protein [Stellaceae bacterium]|nr:DUF6134 family protein [Stellaceae bacterium]